MVKKKSITTLAPTFSGSSNGSKNVDSSIRQEEVMKLLTSTNHNHRIDGLNTIASIIKQYNVQLFLQPELFKAVFALISDKMMNVAVTAVGVLCHVAQLGDVHVLSHFVGENIPLALFQLIAYIMPMLPSLVNGVVITKKHDFYWYNANYLTSIRMLNQIVKILTALCEVNHLIPQQFATYFTQDNFTPNPSSPNPQQSIQPLPNLLQFFIHCLQLDLSTINPAIISSIHLPFITAAQLQILQLLSVLTHDNVHMAQLVLQQPIFIQFITTAPQYFLQRYKDTQTKQLSTFSSTELSSDSVYIYQYCHSIAFSNLLCEYQKKMTNSKKMNSLSTSFQLFSWPHSNLEMALHIGVIIANIIHLIPQIIAQQSPQSQSQQQSSNQFPTILSLQSEQYQQLITNVLNIIQESILSVNITQEIELYTQNLQFVEQTVLAISNGDLSSLEKYQFMIQQQQQIADAQLHQPQQHSTRHSLVSKQQFCILNVNNPTQQSSQQEMLIQSLQQQHVLQTNASNAAEHSLNEMSADEQGGDGMDMAAQIDDQQSVIAIPSTSDNEEFPLQQLIGDAIQTHNIILAQYFHIKHLTSDCLAMLFQSTIDWRQQQQDQEVTTTTTSTTTNQNKHSSTSSVPPSLPQFVHEQNNQLATIILSSSFFSSVLNHANSHFIPSQFLNNNQTTQQLIAPFVPPALSETLYQVFAVHSEFMLHISQLSYQCSTLRMTSLQLFMNLIDVYSEHPIWSQEARFLHDIIVTLACNTSPGRLPVQQQTIAPSLEQYHADLTQLEFSYDRVDAQQKLPDVAMQHASRLLTVTPLDELNLIAQILSLLVHNETTLQTNQALWKALPANVISSTESLQDAQLQEIAASSKSLIYVQMGPVGLSFAQFLAHIVPLQQSLYTKKTQSTTTPAPTAPSEANKILANEFKQSIFQYITSVGTSYPLFGPMFATFIPKILTDFMSVLRQQDLSALPSTTSTTDVAEVFYDVINCVIDIYSEDDRLIASYKNNKLTSALQGLSTSHTAYFNMLKTLVNNVKKMKKSPGKKQVALAAKVKNNTTLPTKIDNSSLFQDYEATSECNANLLAFIQYKKQQKL